MRARAATAVVAVVVASCAALLSACIADATSDVDDVCASYADVAIPPAAPGAESIAQTFEIDNLGQVQSLASVLSNLQFLSATAHATSGVTNFDFVEAAQISIASAAPGSQLPTLDVYACDGDCAPAGSALTVPSSVEVSALAYVESGAVRVGVSLAGQPPEIAWTMAIDVCFAGQVEYRVGL